ncbi:hypothetical protein HPB51_005423 [Rhipicephalus microplus]|uniref:HAT C-terminal dimerisation domain-containing protein n=1 Tax=Rhipicephalus microplus TaxID=6941 RepID=A0A9J6DSV2_RHIMP|nr:hypothetical protein HPB51_005423 [Rhipicephalus microplus]
MKRHSATTKQRSLASYFKKVRTDEADGEEPPPSKDKTSPSSALVESQAVYMNHLRTNTSWTPMRRREMMVAAVQLQVIFVLQSTLGKVTPLPLGNAQGRYVGHDTSEVPILEEDFVDFVPVYDLTGKALANTILNSLRGHGFDLNLLCGQGYDGAASMSGHLNGVQAFIRRTAPKAFLLSILATLPVSTSTPERTFSTLRRLKSYLRNHMNNDRLTGLALLSIHRELQVTPEQVLTEFCKLPRRKNFLV